MGIEANNTELVVTDSIIHDVVAEAVLLKGESTARIDQLLAHDVGARAFHSVIEADYGSECTGPVRTVGTVDEGGWGTIRVKDCPNWGPHAVFRTAFGVEKGSTAEIARLTLINPKPQSRAEAFSVAGKLVLQRRRPRRRRHGVQGGRRR